MSRTWRLCGTVLGGALLMASSAVAQEGATTISHKVVQVHADQVTIDSKVRVPFEAKVVTGAPYSAEVATESTQVLPDGNRIVNRTSGRVYRDSQGRVRREEDREPGVVGWVSISDPVAKASYSLDPETNLALKTNTEAGDVVTIRLSHATTDPAELDRREMIRHEVSAHASTEINEKTLTIVQEKGDASTIRHRKAEWDETVEQLPAREIEGVQAEGTRTTRTIPAGRIGNERPIVIVSEEWRSPALGIMLLTTTSDPRTGESTYRLTAVSRSEPAASLFEVPSGYTVKDSGMRMKTPRPKQEQ